MSNPAKGRILVTGGAGYIGSHTVLALLEAGYDTVLIDNFSNSEPKVLETMHLLSGQAITCLEADCTQAHEVLALLKPLHADVPFTGIIHFAAYKAVGESVADPLKYYHNNPGSMHSVLYWMQQLDIPHLVFSSSCTVYGQPDSLPVTENSHTGHANSPYGRTKQICEQMITDYLHAQPAHNSCLLRYFNPIGAHPSGRMGELPIGKPNNLVPYLAQAAAGRIDPLNIFGTDYPTPDGTAVRDYIHVCDLADAHVRALDYLHTQPGGLCEALNVGTGIGVSVQQLVDTFAQATGVTVPYTYGPRRAGDIAEIYAQTARIQQLLDWQPRFTLADALRHAWQFTQQQAGA